MKRAASYLGSAGWDEKEIESRNSSRDLRTEQRDAYQWSLCSYQHVSLGFPTMNLDQM